MLSWSAAELARRAGVHISTVQRIERNGPALRGNIATLEKVRRALEDSGIEFLDETGVRFDGAAQGAAKKGNR